MTPDKQQNIENNGPNPLPVPAAEVFDAEAVSPGELPVPLLETTVTTTPNRIKKIGFKVLGTVVGTALIVGSLISLSRDNAGRENQITPTEESIPDDGETFGAVETSTTLTTVKGVELNPVTSSTTVRLVSEKPAAATTTMVEAKKPELQPLGAAEVESIKLATGYNGLFEHSLGVVDRFKSPGGNDIVIVSVDGGEMTVSMEKFKSYIQAAETDAASRPTFKSQLQIGPGTAGVENIAFEIGPSRLKSNSSDTQYYFFAGAKQDLTQLASPVKAFEYAFTINRPGNKMTATIVKPQSGEASPGVPSNEFNMLTEVIQANIMPSLSKDAEDILTNEQDLSYLTTTTDPLKRLQDARSALLLLGREIYAGSKAYSWLYEKSFDEYSRKAPTIQLVDYPKNGAFFFVTASNEVGQLVS